MPTSVSAYTDTAARAVAPRATVTSAAAMGSEQKNAIW